MTATHLLRTPLRAVLLLLLVLTARFAFAGAAPSSPADLAFEAARSSILTRTPESARALDAGFAFFLGFPEDPRTQGLLPALARLGDRLPEEARASHASAYHARIAAALAQPDLKDAAREGILDAQATIELMTQDEAEKPDLAAIRAKIDALAARYPKSATLPALELGHAQLLARTDAPAGEAVLRRMAESPDPDIARMAGESLRFVQLRTKPMEMKFTAADGRQVDLATLRGKVVLIDFWATWCGPCIAELPNLTRVYREYHPKGFEIVGISFENANVVDETARQNPRNAGRPLDTPEQAAKKMEAAKTKLLQFTRDHEMPWPQHFDGRHWDNELGRLYGIQSIPAMFLLDREGRLVETEARGPRLEPLVKKLLGLTP